jgi:hypothetical protein
MVSLADLLDYTGKQYLNDRTDIVDGDPDSLWSDAFLVRQFNEAQRILARRAWCIIDEGVAPFGVITLVTNQPVYNLDKSIMRVLLATPTDQDWPLWRTSDTVLRAPRPWTDLPFDINNTTLPAPGRPIAYSTDAGWRQMRVFRTPSLTENGLQIKLKVARLPYTWLTLDNVDAQPEVPEDYHYMLATYAAGKALTVPNVDGAQKAEGRALLKEFDDFVKEARQDRQRMFMEPATWGFQTDTSLLGGVGTR